MQEFVDIKDFNEWKTFVDNILDKHSERKFVFRGQTKNYAFVPSMKRATNDFEHFDMPLTTFQWEILIWKTLKELGIQGKLSSEKYRFIGMALLQHYGYRSWFIDVTKTPEIALWFALNKHLKETTFFLRQDNPEFHPLMHVPTSYYVPADTSEGYFCIIDVTDSANVYVDLTQSIPKMAARVSAQDAGALFEQDNRRLDDLIFARIRLGQGILRHTFSGRYTYDRLFPSPKEDSFYRYLLTLPYFVPTNYLTKHMAPAFPVLAVPFYRHSISEVFDYRPTIKILTVPSFLPVENGMLTGIHLDYNPTCVVKGREFKFVEALQILLPQYLSKYPSYLFQIPESESDGHRSRESQKEEKNLGSIVPDLSIWPSNNMLIVFALSPLFLPLGESTDEYLPKGFWVVFENDEIFISRFGFEGLSGVIEAGMHFAKEGATYQIEQLEGDCSCGNFGLHKGYLDLFLFICRQVHSRLWTISPPCMGHRHLVPKTE